MALVSISHSDEGAQMIKWRSPSIFKVCEENTYAVEKDDLIALQVGRGGWPSCFCFCITRAINKPVDFYRGQSTSRFRRIWWRAPRLLVVCIVPEHLLAVWFLPLKDMTLSPTDSWVRREGQSSCPAENQQGRRSVCWEWNERQIDGPNQKSSPPKAAGQETKWADKPEKGQKERQRKVRGFPFERHNPGQPALEALSESSVLQAVASKASGSFFLKARHGLHQRLQKRLCRWTSVAPFKLCSRCMCFVLQKWGFEPSCHICTAFNRRWAICIWNNYLLSAR